jgi:hypothetical protein
MKIYRYSEYTGQFYNDCFHGYGILMLEDGCSYEGGWEED